MLLFSFCQDAYFGPFAEKIDLILYFGVNPSIGGKGALKIYQNEIDFQKFLARPLYGDH